MTRRRKEPLVERNISLSRRRNEEDAAVGGDVAEGRGFGGEATFFALAAATW